MAMRGPIFRVEAWGQNVDHLRAFTFPLAMNRDVAAAFIAPQLLKQFSVALQPSMRFIGAKVCGIEAIGLEPFEQCRKGGTCGGRRCILRHMSNQQVGNGGRLLWSWTLKGNPRMLAGGRSQECHNPEGLSKAHDRSGLGRIHASLISRPRASRPMAAKAASESATTTTVMARTAR